tara:strand:+ start:72 stop:692 length:621 start_codon:yes stop_codon:yes gene_type:complete
MFNEDGYEVRKNVIGKETLELVYNYYKLKLENNEFDTESILNPVPGSNSLYGDTLGDVILQQTLPLAQEVIGEELYPCYTFVRIYHKGHFLEPHHDRISCEFSITLPIYFDKPWPIYMQKYDFEKYGEDFVKSTKEDPSKSIILEVGDMCFYEGPKMNHWRFPYDGNECVQLFVHYVRKNGEYSKYKFDKRKNLGLKRVVSNESNR